MSDYNFAMAQNRRRNLGHLHTRLYSTNYNCAEQKANARKSQLALSKRAQAAREQFEAAQQNPSPDDIRYKYRTDAS